MKPDFKKWCKKKAKETGRPVYKELDPTKWILDEINQFAEDYAKHKYNEGYHDGVTDTNELWEKKFKDDES